MDENTLWKSILADLELQVSKAVFHTFFLKLSLVMIDDNKITLGCSQPMLMGLIENRYKFLIKKSFEDQLKKEFDIIFIPAKEKHEKEAQGPLFTEKPKIQNLITPRLNPDYTFENFAVSSSNQMAYAAATAVAKSPGSTYNPLFLYGGVGVGKTHLMQAIAHAILKNKPDAKFLYCTSEDFTNEIIEAISNKKTVVFKKKFRKLDVLLIDDIQFIAGKMAVQEEFFHTFNAIEQVKGQIILTSDRPPEEIKKLEERLRSRFEGGLTIDIGPPDFELRCAILLIKAKHRGVDVPMDLIKLVAANVENPRKLEGIFIRVLTEAQTLNLTIDESLVKKVLGKTARETPKKSRLEPSAALEAIANYFNIKTSQIKGDKRDKNLAVPRQILYYILRTELDMPLMDIGVFVGGRDHSTILHGVRKISTFMHNKNKISDDIMGIKQKLFG